MFPPHSQLAEGYDLQFHTNVTGELLRFPCNQNNQLRRSFCSSGHWYLTELLVPTMIETAERSPPKSVRVVNVSSAGHYAVRSQPMDFGSFKGGPQRDKYDSAELYTQSKFVRFSFVI